MICFKQLVEWSYSQVSPLANVNPKIQNESKLKKILKELIICPPMSEATKRLDKHL